MSSHEALTNLRDMDRILREVGFSGEIHEMSAPIDYVKEVIREMRSLGVDMDPNKVRLGDTLRLELRTGAKFEITADMAAVH